ncbi:hypothetical protein EZS27_026863 [termite gut metagenome]|uniref:Glycosyl hydrolase family 92 domain-containing protein n=1 Tax=termite gut metagenome TaxID=433724 RepID=A0A5J4QR19_9ZZZZ
MIMESQFRNDLMDIPGDEDGDGMSAYCMFSAMGFYPVSAGKPVSASAVSCIPKQSIHLNNGNVYHQSQQCLMEQQIHPIGKVERTGVEQTVVHP